MEECLYERQAPGTGAIFHHIQWIISTIQGLADQFLRIIIMKKAAYCTGTRCFPNICIFFLPLFHPSGVIG
jgi:hypothetical protein